MHHFSSVELAARWTGVREGIAIVFCFSIEEWNKYLTTCTSKSFENGKNGSLIRSQCSVQFKWEELESLQYDDIINHVLIGHNANYFMGSSSFFI